MEAYSILNIPDSGVNLDKPLASEWLNANLNLGIRRQELTVSVETDGRAVLALRRIDPEASGAPVVQVSGTVTANIKTQCVRCLEHVAVEILGHVEQTLFPAPSDQPKDQECKSKQRSEPVEVELFGGSEDLDDDTYQGQEIDLPSIVRESILLELDMNTTCQDENSCETRTQALLARVRSEPEKPQIDPRWAALKKFC